MTATETTDMNVAIVTVTPLPAASVLALHTAANMTGMTINVMMTGGLALRRLEGTLMIGGHTKISVTVGEMTDVTWTTVGMVTVVGIAVVAG